MLLNLVFQTCALRALLAKSSRDHDGRFDTSVDALSEDRRNCLRRSHNEREINSVRDISNVLLRSNSGHLGMARIDGINLQREFALQQIQENA